MGAEQPQPPIENAIENLIENPEGAGGSPAATHAQPQPEPRFERVVSAPQPRLRLGFVVALLVVMAAGLVVLLGTRGEPPATRSAPRAASAIDPHCTPLEVELALRDASLTDTQRVVCLAVAGRIEQARTMMLGMPADRRDDAIQAVFTVAHPIADAGDDRSAGPIMALVVELWPDNYMAMFHAGMAEFALGHDAGAGDYLRRFLVMYPTRDVWHERAEQALAAIAIDAPLDRRVAHFPE